MINSKHGFTMIEFLIVLVISSILVVIFAVSRKSQIKSTYFREADVLISDIVNKENLAHMAGNKPEFYAFPRTSFIRIGGLETVDGRKYMYFNEFEVSDATASSFIVTVYGNNNAKGIKRRAKYQDGDIILMPD